jgi:histidine triad (HIT) family protein
LTGFTCGLPAKKEAILPVELNDSKGKSMTTIFAQIISGERPADILYQDELVTAFRDINPQAPTHVLVVPNKVIETANDLSAEDEQIAGRMLLVAKQIAKEEGVAADGYRLIINCNRHGGQEVYHLHMHVIGGRPLGPMLMRR